MLKVALGLVLAPLLRVGDMARDEALNATVAIRWDSQSAREVLTQLAAQAQCTVWIDDAIRAELDKTRLNHAGVELRRIDAMRLAVRRANADCWPVCHHVVVARADHAPDGAQIARRVVPDHLDAGAAHSVEMTARLLERRASLQLTDVTFTRFCQALWEAYGVTAEVTPSLAPLQALITIEGADQRLRDVLTAASDQAGVSIYLLNDVVRVGPAGGLAGPRAGGSERIEDRGENGSGGDVAAAGRVNYRNATVAWSELAAAAGRAGFDFRLPHEFDAITMRGLTAEGPVGAVVEAALLAEGEGWEIGPDRVVTRLPERLRDDRGPRP